ncbi:MAG: acyl carrier protein [candidate division Zixibacteria bacterium]|nr:acyl carrier protein [candidate division Zixibacteria bacterium]
MQVEAEKVRGEIRQFIVDTFLLGDESVNFSDSDSFMRKGIVDSMGILELTGFLEQKYGITVADNEMLPTNLDSVECLLGYIRKKLAG